MNIQRPAGYAIDMSDAELRRLLRLAEVGSDAVRSACFLAGIPAGATVIDVGCGALGALRDLASVVGPSGAVIGIDVSTEALACARQALDQIGISWVQVRRVDIHADDLVAQVCPPGPFDLAFCRLFLMHQSDPAATLRRIASVVRPGGTIIAQEPIVGSLDSEMPKALKDAMAIFYESVKARGGTPGVGRDMMTYSVRAGLEMVRQSAHAPYAPGVGPIAFAAATLRNSRRAIAELGRYPDEEVDALINELEAAINNEKYARPMPGGLAISAQMRVPG